ncbi:MAG: zinc ribbon domain-containing protein [bacterium]
MEMPKGPFCQSCGMPMEKDEHFGTNADRSKNEEYCTYCYQNGEFTEPNMTEEEMMKKISEIMKQKSMSAEEIENATKFLSTLKRWKS